MLGRWSGLHCSRLKQWKRFNQRLTFIICNFTDWSDFELSQVVINESHFCVFSMKRKAVWIYHKNQPQRSKKYCILSCDPLSSKSTTCAILSLRNVPNFQVTSKFLSSRSFKIKAILVEGGPRCMQLYFTPTAAEEKLWWEEEYYWKPLAHLPSCLPTEQETRS